MYRQYSEKKRINNLFSKFKLCFQAQSDTKDYRIRKEPEAHQKEPPSGQEVPSLEAAVVFRRRPQKNPTHQMRSASATIFRAILVEFQIRQDRHYGMHALSRYANKIKMRTEKIVDKKEQDLANG